MEDLTTRDYDVNDIGQEDGRFTDCKKEALIVQITCFCVTVLGVILAYVLSPSLEEATSATYILGYPTWALVPAMLFIAESIFFVVMGLKFFKRPSLEARAENTQEVS